MIQTASENIDRDVLIVDNDPAAARVLLKAFAEISVRGTIATGTEDALRYLDKKAWKLILLNVETINRNADVRSINLLRKIRSSGPELPVIITCNPDSAQTAVREYKTQCNEFLVKPIVQDAIDKIVATYLDEHEINTIIRLRAGDNRTCTIVGTSAQLHRTVEMAKKAAPTSAPVLIQGQSGTGKELIAQLIHNHSKRADNPFIKLNCAALSDSLLESELFGHEKGAFTGACVQRKGRFERAHGGTLLLDEITETPPAFQAKLLRVIEEMCFQRVGGIEDINVNVRIISTTNADILNQVENGCFRADLYYRLASIRLVVPPLKDRPEDINQLIWYFINMFAHETKRPITGIDPQMLEICRQYHWPGNIRQLRNIVRSTLIFGSGQVLSLTDVPWLLQELAQKEEPVSLSDDCFTDTPLKELEEKAILSTLQRTNGNHTKAAKVLGISGRTLREKVKKYRTQGRFQPIG